MFFFKWAAKNLLRNRNRSIGMIILISFTTMILYLGLAFLNGSQKQMTQVLRDYVGDIRITTKNKSNDISDIVLKLRNSQLISTITDITSEYKIYCEFISINGYSTGWIIGSSQDFFSNIINKVEWIDGSANLKQGQCIIEKSFAAELGVNIADELIISYITPNGAINTAYTTVSGVFIGNKYEHSNKVFVKIQDAQELGMSLGHIHQIKIKLLNPDSNQDIQQVVSFFEKYFNIVQVQVWKWKPEGHVFFQVFQYSKIFMGILITISILVLSIVLFFSIQNSFYLMFNERSNEISVLATYGMSFKQMYKLTFWESVILLTSGITLGLFFSIGISIPLEHLNLTSITEEIVVILGGPKLVFEFIKEDILLITVFVFITGMISAFQSLRKYLKSEIREMQLGI